MPFEVNSLRPDNRPALKELFAFLDTQKDRFYIIIDDISLRKAKHPVLIDMETFNKIQERLGLRAKAPYRKDMLC